MELGGRWRNQRRQRKLANAMAGFEDDPLGAVSRVTEVDPELGYTIGRQVKQDQSAAVELAKKQKLDEQTRKAAALKDMIGYLRPTVADPTIRNDPNRLGAAYDSMLPIMTGALGMQPEEILQYRQMFIQNPAILDDIEKAADIKTGAPGTQFVSTQGGRVNVLHTVPYADTVTSVKRADGGTDVVPVPRTYNGTSPIRPMEGGVPVAEGARTVRLANPGAIKDGPFARSQAGYAGSDGTFAKFQTPEHGAAAARTLLQSYIVRGYDTVDKIIDRWAPQGAENSSASVSNYKAHVAARVGLAPGERVTPDKIPALVQAMAEFEAGGASPAAAPGGVTPLYTTPGKATGAEAGWRQLTPEEVSERNLDKRGNWQMSPDGQIKLIGPAGTLGGKRILPEDKQARYDTLISGVQSLKSAALELRRHPGLNRAVGLTSVLPSIPGGAAADFDADLTSLKSKIGFNVLQTMRDMSKTGGALGNISNYENKILQNNLAALEQSQSPEQFTKNLDKVVSYADTLIKRYTKAYNTDTGRASAAEKPATNNRAVPRAAQDMLRSDPSAAARREFDEIFGAGAAARVLGRK